MDWMGEDAYVMAFMTIFKIRRIWKTSCNMGFISSLQFMVLLLLRD